MIEVKDGMLLYHAGYIQIDKIDLDKGRYGLDFGKGFYLTSSYEQARSYIPQAVKKAKRLGKVSKEFLEEDAIINVYKVHLKKGLSIHCFQSADIDWLHFVASNRDDSLFREITSTYRTMDIIGGKIADDNTARTLSLYVAGAYGEPGEKETDEYVLKLLLPNRLQDQFCFATERAIENLEFVRGERYGK